MKNKQNILPSFLFQILIRFAACTGLFQSCVSLTEYRFKIFSFFWKYLKVENLLSLKQVSRKFPDNSDLSPCPRCNQDIWQSDFTFRWIELIIDNWFAVDKQKIECWHPRFQHFCKLHMAVGKTLLGKCYYNTSKY